MKQSKLLKRKSRQKRRDRRKQTDMATIHPIGHKISAGWFWDLPEQTKNDIARDMVRVAEKSKYGDLRVI
jgi:hypothetical protein